MASAVDAVLVTLHYMAPDLGCRTLVVKDRFEALLGSRVNVAENSDMPSPEDGAYTALFTSRRFVV